MTVHESIQSNVPQPASRGLVPRFVALEQRVDAFEGDLDLGGAPSPVTLLLTTRRLIILPAGLADASDRPSPHRLAAPLTITLAGLGVERDANEVALLHEDGVARVQFATTRLALAFALSTRGAVRALAA